MLSYFKEFHMNSTDIPCIDDEVIVFGRCCGQTKIATNFAIPFVMCIKLTMAN